MQVLVYCFRTLLAVAHPLMPFVTERLWTTLPAQQQQLLIASLWPAHTGAVDELALTQYQVTLPRVPPQLLAVSQRAALLLVAGPSCATPAFQDRIIGACISWVIMGREESCLQHLNSA